MNRYGKAALLLGLVLVAPAQACGPTAYYAPQAGMASLAGQWERKEGKETITLSFTADGRMHVAIPSEGFKLHANCSVTPDGIVYGIFTSTESEDEDEDKDGDDFTDHVFCFRYRVDEGMLIVRDFTSSSKGLADEKFWEGRFKRVATPAAVYTPAPIYYYAAPAPAYSVPPPPAPYGPPAPPPVQQTPRPAVRS